ncbi:hypothetical protein [Burkholderia ubonensis]|uniref:hypothetical protein n=1 Tax=Burkholderia ubonensis TaxID=101571 RepID=UPI00075E5F10|nr:hypothetical protein [Burkholderia ubonensis]KVV07372.1 hypothetical protein WK77_16415 [Burkholderia ubonensis]
MTKPHDRPIAVSVEDVLCNMARLGHDVTVSQAEAIAARINSTGLPPDFDLMFEKHEFLFDLQLDASIRFRAPNEEIARKELRKQLDCASANLGEILGQTIECEVGMNGIPILAEIDGNEPDNAARPVLFQSDPRPITSLDPNQPLYDETGREHQLVTASQTQVVTKIVGVFGVWNRATGECLMVGAQGTRLSNDAPSPEWIAARRQAAGEVFAAMHADAAIARARGDDNHAPMADL